MVPVLHHDQSHDIFSPCGNIFVCSVLSPASYMGVAYTVPLLASIDCLLLRSVRKRCVLFRTIMLKPERLLTITSLLGILRSQPRYISNHYLLKSTNGPEKESWYLLDDGSRSVVSRLPNYSNGHLTDLTGLSTVHPSVLSLRLPNSTSC